jgi:hypothetical protein
MADQQNRDREPLVRVAVAENNFDAELMKDELAAAGIRCMLRNGDVLAVTNQIGMSAPFSIEVLVLEGDAARAAQVLSERPIAPEQGG